jgi:hypothetical protein
VGGVGGGTLYGPTSPVGPERAQMSSVVRERDMTHALKNDEHRRYTEERVKFERVLGPGRGGLKRTPAGAVAPKGK